MKYKNWLILSHAFNMDGRAASQTITDKIPHLLKRGVKLQVLSTISGEKDKNIPHRQIMPWGPSGFIFDFRYLLRKKFGKGKIYKLLLFFVNLILLPLLLIEKILIRLSSQASWALPSAVIGIYRVFLGRADLIYTTGGAWSAHLAGFWIWKVTKVKWIVELHDPLIDISQIDNRRFENGLLVWLERKISKHADIVWWFTEEAEAMARGRNIEISDKGFNSFAGADPPFPTVEYLKKSKINFSHFGSLGSGRSLKPFLIGLKRLIESDKINREEIEVNIYGGQLDIDADEFTRQYHLESIITNHGRIEASDIESGRSKIMNIMAKSDILLVMHGEDIRCREYIPSKFFEYLYSRRPILAYNFENPQFKALLKETGCYEVTNSIESSKAILKVVNAWRNNNLRIPKLVISTEKLVEKIIFKVEKL